MVVIILAVGGLIVGGCSNTPTSSHEEPFFSLEEGKRKRMLQRQAEAMERQNELAEEAPKLQRSPERR